MSSNLGAVTRTRIFPHQEKEEPKRKEKAPTSGDRSMLVHKIRLHGRRGKGTAEPFSREKLTQAPQKEGGEILCKPGWYVHQPDVQNKWDETSFTAPAESGRSGERSRSCVHAHF